MAGVGCGEREGPVDRVQPSSTAMAVRAPRDEVTLVGRVTMTYGRHVFAVGTQPEAAIVVIAEPPAVMVGSVVEVTGRVRSFRRSELEAELGVDLGPQAAALEDESCLVATSVRLR